MGGRPAAWKRPGVMPAQPRTILELLDRVVVCPSGCWLWAGGTSDGSGGVLYGRILRPGTRNAMAAHRYVHEQFVGPIPKGWHVDHLCRVGLCVRPEHLEAVPPRINMARRDLANGREVAAERLMSFEDELVAAFDGA